MITETMMPNEVRTVILTGNGYLLMTSKGDYKQALKELEDDAANMYKHPEYPKDLFLAKRILDAIDAHAYAITEDDTCIEFAEDFYC